MLTTTRIVTRCRGSWRWQDAYGVVLYRAVRAKSGRYVWRSHRDIVQKASEPQLRRGAYGTVPRGGIHNRPVSEESLAFSPAMPPIIDE
jgi:hypothetical protein